MSEEKKALDVKELEGVAGGSGVSEIVGVVKNQLRPALDATAAVKENMAAVCGANTVKAEERTATAYCSKCGKNTLFYLGSGARGKCSICGTVRTDL